MPLDTCISEAAFRLRVECLESLLCERNQISRGIFQRRATKLVKELKNLPYEETLQKLKLTTLEQRRNRGDLMQIYRIINVLEDIHLIKGLKFADSDHFEIILEKVQRRASKIPIKFKD